MDSAIADPTGHPKESRRPGADSLGIRELWDSASGRPASLERLAERRFEEIPLDWIRPNPEQPRDPIAPDSEEFRELMDSIRAQGLLQPVVLAHVAGEDGYVLVAGERRWRACRSLAAEGGSSRITAVVLRIDEAPDAALLGKALTENTVRSDLSTAETARAIARLRGLTGWTYETIAVQLGLSVNRVQALAAIARHEPVLEAVAGGRLTQDQARAIGQGAPDAEAAAELVAQSRGRDLAATKRLVAAKRRPERDLSVPADPVRTPPPLVDAGSLPIARLVGRGPIPRGEVETALAASCAVLGFWPSPP
jgi:ParB family chromosome partitioning protein